MAMLRRAFIAKKYTAKRGLNRDLSTGTSHACRDNAADKLGDFEGATQWHAHIENDLHEPKRVGGSVSPVIRSGISPGANQQNLGGV